MADTPADLAARTVQAVKPSPKWERVEVATAQKDMYSIYIWYRQRPAGFAEVERDTKAVARAMLKTLVDAGQKPAEDWISVFVRGGEKVTGETGRPLSRVFGRTMYDFNNDSLTFRRGN
ncbi:MAG: hypothetical protein Q8R21_03720 [Burkholderiales bacterium]|nr:hypothetical protein [Burkholderiales bacterium]